MPSFTDKLRRIGLPISLAASVAASSCATAYPVGSREWLLTGLQKLVEEDGVLGPGQVEAVLALELTSRAPQPDEISLKPCSDMTEISRASTKYFSDPLWLKAVGGGDGHIRAAYEVPFVYSETKQRYCQTSSNILQLEVDAGLWFRVSQRFCFSEQKLMKWYGVDCRMYTDGVSAVVYGKDDRLARSTKLEFGFGWPYECAVNVSLKQGASYSRQYRDALQKRQDCFSAAETIHLGVHGRSDPQKELDRTVRWRNTTEVCDSFQTYYDREIAGQNAGYEFERR